MGLTAGFGGVASRYVVRLARWFRLLSFVTLLVAKVVSLSSGVVGRLKEASGLEGSRHRDGLTSAYLVVGALGVGQQ